MNSQMESDPPARLDDDQTFLSRNSAGITEGRKHQAFSHQIQIGLEDFLT